MVAGCKCPGSCACKIKKPRKPKVKKAVVGGRVKQPQIVIQGMPPVSTTAIPQGHPYLTVTSDADYTKPFKTKKKAKSSNKSLEAALIKQRDEMDKKFHITLNQIVEEGNEREKQQAKTGRTSQLIADAIAEGKQTKEEPMKELKGESRFLTKFELKTPSQQLSLLKSKIAAGTTKQFPIVRATTGTQAGPSLTTTEVQTEAPTRMTTEAQTNLIEHVGVGTQAGPSVVTGGTQTSMKVRSPQEIAAIAKEQKEAGIVEGFKMGRARESALRTKETKEMGTETEPLLVTVAKGAKQDIFNLMKEQEATGKIVSLTGAGRPARPFNDSLALASPSPSPVRAPPSIPVGSASSSEGVPGYTEVRPRTTEMRTLPTGVPGALYKITRPARVVQMPPEVIDLS